MSKITILIFDAQPDCRFVTLDCPEIRSTPRQTVKKVFDHLMSYEHHHIIRTYSETVLNFIGELIDDNEICYRNVEVCLPDNSVYTFDKEGVLTGKWPYGLMSSYGNVYDEVSQ